MKNKFLTQITSPGYDQRIEDYQFYSGLVHYGNTYYCGFDSYDSWKKYTFKVTDLKRVDRIMELDYTKDVEKFLTNINYLGI